MLDESVALVSELVRLVGVLCSQVHPQVGDGGLASRRHQLLAVARHAEWQAVQHQLKDDAYLGIREAMLSKIIADCLEDVDIPMDGGYAHLLERQSQQTKGATEHYECKVPVGW